MAPPENALVLTVDEKSHIQALDRSQPELPLRPCNSKGIPPPTKGTELHVCWRLCGSRRKSRSQVCREHTHEEFLAFLKSLYRNNPGKHIHIIADNFSSHKHHKVIEWVSRRCRMTLHFTPTYASWLNQVEIFFNIFSRDVIKGGIWHSKQELVQQIMHYIEEYNKHRAHPFKWTYTGKTLAA